MDLRWHYAYDFNAFEYLTTSACWFGGNAAAFGWLNWYNNDITGQFYNAEGGLRRSWSADGVTPVDSRDPNEYKTFGFPYNQATYKRERYTGTYYWYNTKDGNVPGGCFHLIGSRDRRGNTVYYNYDTGASGPYITRITGNTAQLIPYFRIENLYITRMHLQDQEGDDHRTTYYNYDPADFSLTSILEPENVVTYFEINSRLMRKEVAPGLVTTYFGYDTSAMYPAWRMRMQLGDRITYFADNGLASYGVLSGVNREFRKTNLGGVSPHSYNLDSESINGSTIYYGYDSNKLLTAYQDRSQNTTYYAYNAAKLRTRVLGANGGAVYFEYAANNVDVVKHVGPRHVGGFSQVTYFGFDNADAGCRTQTLDPLGYAVYFGYDERNRLDRSLDSRQGVTYYGFDQYSRMTRALDAAGGIAYFRYNAAGLIVRKQNPLGFVTYFTYDKLDQQLSQQSPTDDVLTYEYSPRGLVLREGRPGGRATYYGYDIYKNLTARADVSNAGLSTTYYEFDFFDNAVATIDPDGNRTEREFNALQLPTKEADALGNATYFGYDAQGMRARILDPKSVATYFGYDSVYNRTRARKADVSTYFTYDLSANQTAAVDGRGNTTYYEYDAVNQLIRMRDAEGGAVYYAYDGNRNLVAQLNERAVATYYGYDILNRRTTQALAANTGVQQVTYFAFDAVGNRTAMLFPNRFAAYYGYDGSRRMTRDLDRAGFAAYYYYDANGNRVALLDRRSASTYYQYDLLNRVSAVLDATSQPAYYTYDPASNLTAATNHISPAGSATSYYGYDKLNRVKATLDPLQRVAYYGYDAVSNLTALLLPGGVSSYFAYDALNRRTAILDPNANFTYFGYDAVGNVLRQTDSRSNNTYFAYDALNRLTAVQERFNGYGLDPYGLQPYGIGVADTYFRYDAGSNLTTVLDTRNYGTYFSYDALDRRTAIRDQNANATYFGYDADGNMAVVLPARGGSAYFGYDSRDLLAQTLNGAGDVAYFGYDPNGNRTAVGVPALYSAYFAYDVMNRLAVTQDGMSGAAYFGYDVGGNVNRVRDALARATYFAYDLLDRVTTVQDALNHTVYFGYDLQGNRGAEMDARGNTTYFGYDPGGRLTAVRDPLARAAYYGYDANSNLARTLDNQNTAVYFTYDALNRRTSIIYPTEAQYFGYDLAGNLGTTIDAWGTASYNYDPASRLINRSTPRGDQIYYAYDGANNLIRLQYPQDSATCYYGYDNAQRLEKLRTPSDTSAYFTYDGAGNVFKKTFGNGMVSWAGFDQAGRMQYIRYTKADGTSLTYFDYARDAAGNITKIGRESNLAIYYEYDATNKLLAEYWRNATSSAQVYGFSYEYDAAGNRLRMRRETTLGTEYESTYYGYDLDNSLIKRRVQSSNTNTYYYYDLNGALTTFVEGANSTYFAYGPNQLVTRIKPASEAATYYYYDARLNRYCQNNAGTVSYFLWDGLNPLEERDANGTLKVRYTNGYTRIYGIGSVLEAKRTVGAATYYQYPIMDHRGTVYAIADSNANILTTYTPDAFGQQLAAIGGADPNVPNELIYQTNWQTMLIGGKWWGVSAARMYDFATGQFTQRDRAPISIRVRHHITRGNHSRNLTLSENLYYYTRNAPSIFLDPTGLEACPDDCDPMLGDATPQVNGAIQSVLDDVAANSANIQALITEFAKRLIGGGRQFAPPITGIEQILKDKIDASLMPGQIGRGKGHAYRMKVCGLCIGTDKIGHFIEEGFNYTAISLQFNNADLVYALGYWAEGLNPPWLSPSIFEWLNSKVGSFLPTLPSLNKDLSISPGGADWFAVDLSLAYGAHGDWGVDPRGPASPADIAANEAGFQFYLSLLPMTPQQVLRNYVFNICDWVRPGWDQSRNPNRPIQPRPIFPDPSTIVRPPQWPTRVYPPYRN